MRPPASFVALEEFGHVRLSQYFHMRDFLHSEIGSFHGIPKLPEDPDLAITAGRRLATHLLDPLHETFAAVAVRSRYRSPTLNHFRATTAPPQKCSANERNRAGHICDWRDGVGRMGAAASIVIRWFADRHVRGCDWRDLAWWLYDHLSFHEVCFFPKLAALNLTWREVPERRILSYIPPKGRLLGSGDVPAEDPESLARRFAEFPPVRGIEMP